MKHSLKISSLIIFAATVASAFTSCGNDSELFDEPVVHQTRAMTRASMGGEDPYNRYREGSVTKDITIIEGKVYATIELKWGPDDVACQSAWSFLHERFEDESYFRINHNYRSVPMVDPKNNCVSVEYNIYSVSKKVYNQYGEAIDTIIQNVYFDDSEIGKLTGVLELSNKNTFTINTIQATNECSSDTLLTDK